MAGPLPANSNGHEMAFAPIKATFAITASNSAGLARTTRAIYTGSGGTIVLTCVGDDQTARQILTNVPAGVWLAMMVTWVWSDDGTSPATSTTATGLLGGW
jgi:hypothetical protein